MGGVAAIARSAATAAAAAAATAAAPANPVLLITPLLPLVYQRTYTVRLTTFNLQPARTGRQAGASASTILIYT